MFLIARAVAHVQWGSAGRRVQGADYTGKPLHHGECLLGLAQILPHSAKVGQGAPFRFLRETVGSCAP